MARGEFNNYNRRLWLSGGRSEAPEGSVRRLRGAAPELTGSLMAAWPNTLLYPNIAALNLFRYNNNRYQFDGTKLYKNGVVNDTGYNGNRATIASMSVGIGQPAYLFMLGAGKNIKIDPEGDISQWGIAPPPNAMQGQNNAPETIVICDFDTKAADWTANAFCTKANDNTEFQVGTGSLKITPDGTGTDPWAITATPASLGISANMAVYADGTISLISDIITIWVQSQAPSEVGWLEFDFDVNDGTFGKDYYTNVIQIVANTTQPRAAKASQVLTPAAGQWFNIVMAKSTFTRIGTNLNFDWMNVQKIRIRGGNGGKKTIRVDQFALYGGTPLGIGPTAGNGGETYQYHVTFGNDETGNDSNPEDTPLQVQNVGAVGPNTVKLTDIPISSDLQVTNRKLWRTSGGGGEFFFLDVIGDNTTTTYTDDIGDTPEPFTITPWMASKVYLLNQYVDGGNGYYFKATVVNAPGTTGATPPTWVFPNSAWSRLTFFNVGDTISPHAAAGQFFICTVAGLSGPNQPNWASVGVGSTIVDSHATWQNEGLKVTNDNNIQWTFAGINSTPTLGNTALLFDNILPYNTLEDCVGPYQGSMIFGRDTAAGRMGRVYISPPGRPEAMATFIDVSSDDDPVQKSVIWETQWFVLTSRNLYLMTGQYPAFTPQLLYPNTGTGFPFTVVSTKPAVFYRSEQEIRKATLAENVYAGFEPIAPLFRGTSVEDYPAFFPAYAAEAREEIYFACGISQQTFALNIYTNCWRTFNIVLTALTYEEETGTIVASYGGNVYIFEDLDTTGEIDFEFQTPNFRPDVSQVATIRRIFVDCALYGTTLIPTLVGNASDIATLPTITNTTRSVIEIAFQSNQRSYGLRLANPTLAVSVNRPEIFNVMLDMMPSGTQGT